MSIFSASSSPRRRRSIKATDMDSGLRRNDKHHNVYFSFLSLCVFLLPTLASAASWEIIPEKSSIEFSGTHAGNAFKGTFSRFDAVIDFDKKKLSASKVSVKVDLTSAKTGNDMYDGTLPQTDWLDSEKTTTATFVTTAITSEKEDYLAKGALTIRGKSIPVSVPFTLNEQPNGTTLMEGKTTLKRMDFDIGKESDASGEWVSLEIPLSITIVARAR